MKKLLVVLFVSFVLMMGTAMALPMTWQVSESFNPPAEYIGWYEAKGLSLDLTNDGYAPGMEIHNFIVTAYFTDDEEGDDDGDENMSLIVGTEFVNGWFPDSLSVGWSILGEDDIEDDGILNTFITSNSGDARVWKLELVAIGDDGFSPVPEPATASLLGLGLLGIIGVCRRKSA